LAVTPRLVVIGALDVPFFLRLPGAAQWWFATATVVFLGGALGLELAAVAYLEARGFGIGVGLIRDVENLCEMAGVATFVSGLVSYAQSRFGGIQVMLMVGEPKLMASVIDTKEGRRIEMAGRHRD
jgi:hypothetical protein